MLRHHCISDSFCSARRALLYRPRRILSPWVNRSVDRARRLCRHSILFRGVHRIASWHETTCLFSLQFLCKFAPHSAARDFLPSAKTPSHLLSGLLRGFAAGDWTASVAATDGGVDKDDVFHRISSELRFVVDNLTSSHAPSLGREDGTTVPDS